MTAKPLAITYLQSKTKTKTQIVLTIKPLEIKRFVLFLVAGFDLPARAKRRLTPFGDLLPMLVLQHQYFNGGRAQKPTATPREVKVLEWKEQKSNTSI